MSLLPLIAIVISSIEPSLASVLPPGFRYEVKYDDYPTPQIPRPPPHSNSDDDLHDFIIISLITLGSLFVLTILTGVILWLVRRRIRLSEDELIREEENQAYLELNSDEQELYFQSKEFLNSNPYIVGEMTMSQKLTIQEKGITAYEFQKDSMLTNNDLMIINRFELNFFKNFECSTQTNLPVPMKNEVYYFESKIYSLPHPEDTLISIGLSIKPYPWFRLPGRHAHSICYDSDGYRRYNQPFKFTNDPPFPKLAQGDVVGVGYKTRSGTVFFTRNGKKVSESRIGGHVKNFKIANFGQLFPTVGANNLCSIHVNLGQRGFVFIEGNVKSWGYAPIEGNGPAPPAYRKFNSDILLERSEVDDDNNDLSEREDDFPPDFWEVHGDPDRMESSSPPLIDQDKFSYNAYSDVESNAERITLNSLVPPNTPPAYNEELSIGSSQEVITEQEDEVETNASAQSATESEESEIPDDHSDSRLYEEETEDMEMEFTPEVETTAAGECQDETREDIEEQQ